ncbi:FAM3 metabolism regulating signaling molecule D [Phyllostomus discolor]|uniref:FAM3 metabolism regulating signaling molecule D n=1 Tax=Phyllostomus discolor TaxID=89673 RepID=A0A833ZSY4_9CHIR|nr:FAM3 metabolism regulating signaling molecule D [Phyllostomus discolor]
MLLVKFLKEVTEDMLVLVASYDDPGTKMNDELRELFSNLGSSYAKQLGFRDSWVFLGAKDIKSNSPFEQVGSWQPPHPSEGSSVRDRRKGLGWLGKDTHGGVGRATWLSSSPEVRVAHVANPPAGSGLDHFTKIYINA